MTEDRPRAGQEAARLLAAARDWLGTAAPDLAPVDDAGRTCVCPLCRLIASVRATDPDDVGHWVDAFVAGVGSAVQDVVASRDEPAASDATDATGASSVLNEGLQAGVEGPPGEEASAAPAVEDGDAAGDRSTDRGSAPEPTTGRVRRVTVQVEEPEGPDLGEHG